MFDFSEGLNAQAGFNFQELAAAVDTARRDCEEARQVYDTHGDSHNGDVPGV